MEIELSCLSYCGLSTLTAQIHKQLCSNNQNNHIYHDIDLYTVNCNYGNDALIDPCRILEPVDVNKQCMCLIGKSVVAIAKRFQSDGDDDDVDDMKETDSKTILMKQFYIGVDNKGKVNAFKIELITTTIRTPVHQLSLAVSKGTWFIYYRSRLVSPDDTTTVYRACDAMVIVYTKSQNSNCIRLVEDGYETIDGMWRWLEQSNPTFQDNNTMDYGKVSRAFLSMRQNTSTSPLKSQDFDYSFHDASIKVAIETYNKMALNQKLVSKYLSSALHLVCTATCSEMHPRPLRDISVCLGIYLETQVLDSGASVECAQCKRCEIFKKSTDIVRYPEICTVSLDRFNDGRKYDQNVSFKKELQLNGINYDLYAVCNHSSSSTDFGHYYAYVKSVDKNDSVWYEANDDIITTIRNESQVTNNRNALVLMYQKKATQKY
eukprot:75320_1